MNRPISRQVIVITGASSGIGLATAMEAGRRGAKVVLAARNAADLERAAAAIRTNGGTAIAVPTDVTIYHQVEALARRAVSEWGRIDSWINNAGVSHYAAFRTSSLTDFRRVLEINFFGQIHGARAALPHLEETGGALICVGSTLSDRGVPLQSSYCASKHAIKGWLDSLRVELQREGSPVRVTLIKPSSINTPLFNKAKTEMGVMPMPIPPIYQPELAAEAILRAAEGNERDVFVGGAGKAMSVAERLSPGLLDFQQRKQGFEAQQTDRLKGSDAPHNLYAAVEDDGGIHGDFGDQAHGRSVYQAVDSHPISVPLVGAAAVAFGAVAAHTVGARLAVPLLLALGAILVSAKQTGALVHDR